MARIGFLQLRNVVGDRAAVVFANSAWQRIRKRCSGEAAVSGEARPAKSVNAQHSYDRLLQLAFRHIAPVAASSRIMARSGWPKAAGCYTVAYRSGCRKPALEEHAEPGARRIVIHGAVGKMRVARLARPAAPCGRGRAWSSCASWRGSRRDGIAARRPARSGSPAPRTYRLRPKARRPAARRSLRGAIDRRIPARSRPRRGRRRSAGSGNSRSRHGRRGWRNTLPPSWRAQHLRAEADAEERLVLAQRHADPIDLAADEIVLVVGAHRAAEDDGGGMIGHGRRQRIAEPRPAHVERIAELAQRVADAARRGVLSGAERSGSAVA